jgi:cation:H+ antiporter
MVIGLTIVAFGTSMPEFIVNVMSSAKGANEIAMGNIIGSNILNIAIILGITSIIRVLYVKDNTSTKEIPLTIISGLAVFFLANDKLIDKVSVSQISRADGFVMLMFFIIFLSYTFSLAKEGRAGEEEDFKVFSTSKSTIYIILGLGLLMLGGKLIVDNAVNLARGFGISERIIGLTIVSLGTSLPIQE